MFTRRLLAIGSASVNKLKDQAIIHKNPLKFQAFRCMHTPNDGFIKQGSYEGPGCTTVNILNQEMSHVNLIDSYSIDGFRLNDNTKILGPCIIFPNAVLSWAVGGPKDVTEASLALFELLQPKLDIVVIGHGLTQQERDPVNPKVILAMKKRGTSLEVLRTENAISTYNFLVEEGRLVAAALIPPASINYLDEDAVEATVRNKVLIDRESNYLGLGKRERRIIADPRGEGMDSLTEVPKKLPK